MFKHKYKLRFTGNAEKVEQMYQQREKELKQLKKLQKKDKERESYSCNYGYIRDDRINGFSNVFDNSYTIT